MPELPEVETVARQLKSYYLGKIITEVETKPGRIFINCTPKEFSQALINKKLQNIDRYGKFLIWEVDGIFPVFHLGMSGAFFRDRNKTSYPKHIHLSFKFSDNSRLFFQDIRKFGKILIFKDKPQFPELGPDPFSENFTLINLRELLNLSAVVIKTFLMDQHRIAGIGNIYANEILYRAGISPFRPARSINRKEAEKLFQAIRYILQKAISNFGTTYSVFQTVEGIDGENQNFLKVYQKEGKTCSRCGGEIKKVYINKRSTFFCEKCQK